MVAVCQQPNYFPWLGYLEQCARADVLVVLDSVQWIRQGRQHRTRLLPHASSKAEFQWLTLPVRGHGHRERPLRELELSDRTWPRRHWATITALYGRRPFFEAQVEALFRPWFEREAPGLATMAEAAIASLKLALEAFEIRPEIMFSSQLPEQGTKTERLISLCQAVGADSYYSALGSTRYVDVSLFRAAGIRLVWQHWKHPEYPQGRARPKTHLSVIDALANVPLGELKTWLAPQPFGPFMEERP